MIEVDIDEESKLITATCIGTLNEDDLSSYLADNWAGKELLYDELFIAINIKSELNFSSMLEHGSKAADYNQYTGGNRKSAVVVNQPEILPLAKVYAATQSLKDVRVVRIFENVELAREWLDEA